MALSPQHRADIQGLRAIAVIAVILGHLFPSTIKGGFIGVDIFFVISGFVITQQMMRSQAKSPHTFIRDFYYRRIKRILPAAVLVTAVSIYAAKYFLGPVVANQTTLDGAWVSIFLGNFHFHDVAIDYFSTGVQQSPLQHYWSLSIEEQFYLVWPALFAFLIVKLKNQSQRMAIVAVITAASLALALYQSEITGNPIFFATQTRIWELALGALLALSARLIRVPRFVIYFSFVVFIATAVMITPTMQWPNVNSLPIIIATAVLLVNNPRVSPVSILQNKVITYIGDISYVLYLWHWPILTIYKGYAAHFGVQEKIITIVATIFLSVSTHHLFENPIRFSNRVKPLVGISIGLASILAFSALLFSSYQG